MKISLLIPALIASAASSSADVIYVPDDHATIQEAIEAAVDGDTVLVRPGTYVERIDFLGKAITVQSTHGRDMTTIDADATGTAVKFLTSEKRDSVLRGFTITNGVADPQFNIGGGIVCGQSSPTIEDNRITNCLAVAGGGLACADFSSPAVLHNEFDGNLSELGGAILLYSWSSPKIEGNVIAENRAYWGGGIAVLAECFPRITDTAIVRNTAESKGGGIWCSQRVVEDDDILLELIRDRLRNDGAEVLVAESSLAALLRLGAGQIDVVITEVRPPGGSHVELICEVINRNPRAGVILLASSGERSLVREGLAAGAVDFVTKPFRYDQLRHMVEQLLRWRELRDPEELRQVQVRRVVQESPQGGAAGLAELEEIPTGRKRIHIESVLILAKVAEFNDQETANHLLRVSRHAAITATELGLPEWEVEDIALAAPLHDIGKVAIDHRVLRRRGPLSPEERVEMKLHTIRGAEILGGVDSFRTACQIARHHHERFDGRGYPDGLAGDNIPLAARIVVVVDVFDALATRRCYKQAWPVEDAMDYLWRQGARQFDLEVVSAFSNAEERVRQVHEELKDAPRGSLLDYTKIERDESKNRRPWGDSIQVS